MTEIQARTETVDVFVIGGGINGCGIARDVAGRGLSVTLAEMGDLAQATSSASTKLFHGGLRYLEFFEIGLVRHALEERETLLRAMPHIAWPMRFVLPYHKDMRFDTETPASKIVNRVMPWTKGRRPAWMIRFGLFLYDNLGGRKVLPGTWAVDLHKSPLGAPLKRKFRRAFEYSDCWVQDARLVVLNARDAEARGGTVMTRTKVIEATRDADAWSVVTEDLNTGQRTRHRAKCLVNAGGPWVENIVRGVARINTSEGVRLVRGSHIVTKKLYDHDKCYFFQGGDGRIIFAIPYEEDFTLIGTTDAEHDDDPLKAEATDAEQDYLCAFASEYFDKPVTRDDIVWTYSGVRPLYDDGAKSATAATRDYVLSLDDTGPPICSFFGGKITTYRKLAEDTFDKIAPFFPAAGPHWSAGVALPGGDFPVKGAAPLEAELKREYPFLTDYWARRMVRHYGMESSEILGSATTADDLGEDFGATLTAAEVTWLMTREYAQTAEDVVWRRTKLGLRLTPEQIGRIDAYMAEKAGALAAE
ncbi:MAG: glycerol-3-phosphate dehydrogenase [Pseudomonadota bacterium]